MRTSSRAADEGRGGDEAGSDEELTWLNEGGVGIPLVPGPRNAWVRILCGVVEAEELVFIGNEEKEIPESLDGMFVSLLVEGAGVNAAGCSTVGRGVLEVAPGSARFFANEVDAVLWRLRLALVPGAPCPVAMVPARLLLGVTALLVLHGQTGRIASINWFADCDESNVTWNRR